MHAGRCGSEEWVSCRQRPVCLCRIVRGVVSLTAPDAIRGLNSPVTNGDWRRVALWLPLLNFYVLWPAEVS